MILFTVRSLFTNVLIGETVETILQKIYVEKKIKTSIPKPILKKQIILCTKHLHFIYNISSERVTKGPTLDPLLANILMISLEEKVPPTVSN